MSAVIRQLLMTIFHPQSGIPKGASLSRALLILPWFAFLAGCAKTTFIPVENGTRTVGKGAILRNVNGIDFWSDGQPPRPYRIIGVIHDRRNALRKEDLLKDLARAAKRMQGDAVLEYQAYGALSGGATAGAASATQNALMLGALASGPAVTFVGPLAAAVAATQGGQSRWWVAKYLPEKRSKTAHLPNTSRTSPARKQPSPPNVPQARFSQGPAAAIAE